VSFAVTREMRSAGQRIYLAYGSNLHPRRIAARVGPVQLIGVVELPGWALRFDKRGGDGSAKANLRAMPGLDETVYAAAYRLGLDQVRRLDHFEGTGQGYQSFPMTISLAGQSVHAFTYLAPSQWLAEALLPFDWYVDLIISGACFHQFDETYRQKIQLQPVCADPSRCRARSELKGMELPLRSHYKT